MRWMGGEGSSRGHASVFKWNFGMYPTSAPLEVDSDAATAKVRSGVLTLTVPKKIRSGAQRLTIN